MVIVFTNCRWHFILDRFLQLLVVQLNQVFVLAQFVYIEKGQFYLCHVTIYVHAENVDLTQLLQHVQYAEQNLLID